MMQPFEKAQTHRVEISWNPQNSRGKTI